MTILITGTTGGIGGAVKALAEKSGHTVIEFNRADFEALADPQFAIQKFANSPIDAVVFCTGTCPIKPVALTSEELLMETFQVNCGLFHRLIKYIVAEKLYNPLGMQVIAVSSVSATEGWAGGTAYCASKGALSALARAYAAELKPKKISVTALEPRYIKTKMFDNGAGRMGVDESQAIAPEAFAAEILSRFEIAAKI